MAVQERRNFYINGRWCAPSDPSRSIPVYSSVTEEVLETVPAGGPADVDAAVRAASAALPAWSALSVSERAGFLRRMAAGLKARANVLAPLISEEVGMPIAGALDYQSLRAAEFLNTFADVAESFEFEDRIGDSLVVREPVGCGRRDQPIQLSAPADSRQGGTRARRRLHRRDQAAGDSTRHDLPSCRGRR